MGFTESNQDVIGQNLVQRTVRTRCTVHPYDKYKTIYDREDPPGTYPDQRHVLLKDSKTKGPLLKCGSNKISVIFDEAELAGSSLKARNPTEIFFRNHENCHSQKQDDKLRFKILIFLLVH